MEKSYQEWWKILKLSNLSKRQINFFSTTVQFKKISDRKFVCHEKNTSSYPRTVEMFWTKKSAVLFFITQSQIKRDKVNPRNLGLLFLRVRLGDRPILRHANFLNVIYFIIFSCFVFFLSFQFLWIQFVKWLQSQRLTR